MTVSVHRYTLELDAAIELDPKGGTVTMDEGWAPHVQAQITIARPADDILDLLDPRDAHRVQAGLQVDYPDALNPAEHRTLDLVLAGVDVDTNPAEVTLTLASDEVLLQNDVLMSELDFWEQQTSLRAIVDGVLGRIGAHLEAGGPDADMSPHWDVENLFPNPSAETNTTYWMTGAGASGMISTPLVSPPAPLGGNTIRWTAATGASNIIAGNTGTLYNVVRVSAGRTYTGAVTVLSAGGARARQVHLRFFAADGTTQLGNVASSTTSGTALIRQSATGIAPVGAAYAAIIIATTGNTAGQYWYADAAMIYEGDREIAPFDGAKPADADYVYAWSGTAHASSSTRTAILPSDPDALVWAPGVTAWDFIQPLVTANGGRLFCDEQRHWHLVDGENFTAPGAAQLTHAVNLTESAAHLARGDQAWFDAAIVRYRWTDARTGQAREQLDAYAPPGYVKGILVDLARPYPGAGYARYLVRRAAGRGRTLTLSAVSRYTVTPSQPIVATLPGMPTQTGAVASVRWDLGTDLMRVTTRGLADTPDTAIRAFPPGVRIIDLRGPITALTPADY